MKRRTKTFLVVFCSLVSVTAGLLSILQTLGYLKPVKQALGLP